MRGFCVALLLLAALCVGVFVSAHRVNAVLSELTETLKEQGIDATERLWRSHGLLLRLTLHRSEISQIDERLAALKSAASLGDTVSLEIERARLLSALRRARETISPSLSDIF